MRVSKNYRLELNPREMATLYGIVGQFYENFEGMPLTSEKHDFREMFEHTENILLALGNAMHESDAVYAMLDRVHHSEENCADDLEDTLFEDLDDDLDNALFKEWDDALFDEWDEALFEDLDDESQTHADGQLPTAEARGLVKASLG